MRCACHEICTSRFTKRCACHEICTLRFTKRCACHEICTSRVTKHPPRNLHFEVHQALCLPGNLHFEAHQALHLPRKLLFEVIQLRSLAPVTKSDRHERKRARHHNESAVATSTLQPPRFCEPAQSKCTLTMPRGMNVL